LPPAFTLHVAADGLATLVFDLPGRKVNVFTLEVGEELGRMVAELAARRDIACLVLLSGKPGTFIAGADVDAIAGVSDPAAGEEASRLGQRLFAAWEALPFPTVAAVQGTCLGGGTELALAATHILVSDRPDLRIGLPEVRLGILPGWGGCTRLPRRIGIADALDIILAGKAVPGRTARKLGLADALLPDAGFLHQVREFARGVVAGGGRRRGSERPDLRELLLERNPLGRKLLFDQARKQTLALTHGHYPAPLRAIEVVRVGIEQGREAGFAAEARALGELVTTPVCKNLIHVFRLMEAAKKEGDGPLPRPVESAAVLGAGVMGGGIAYAIADQAGVPVRLRDIQPQPLAGGLAHAAALLEKQVERRRLSRAAARRKLALLRPTLALDGLARADLVIEAVVENLEVKQRLFAQVAALVDPDCVLASNTSSLSIDRIARDTPRPERVVGMHFFNPVHKMPLVEVVVGPRTSVQAARTVAAFARRLGKTPVQVKDGPGFLVNRVLAFYMAEAMWLLGEGHPIETIDGAMVEWGMPMGPIALVDEVGIDVAVKVAHILGEAFGDRLAPPAGQDRLLGSGRLGTKSGRGFYRYRDGRRAEPDPEVYSLLGVEQRLRAAEPSLIVDRMVLPMLNEAARCLEEGVVSGPAELDLAMILGTGFPPFRGGLCRWADAAGLRALAGRLEGLASAVGDRFRPAEALLRAAAAGGFYPREA
jgi:3-hydroxyacyl-CoA dehydrogenase/enoyl-CoA hydratase/3-hydroxybutyryl-CoA epimerase